MVPTQICAIARALLFPQDGQRGGGFSCSVLPQPRLLLSLSLTLLSPMQPLKTRGRALASCNVTDRAGEASIDPEQQPALRLSFNASYLKLQGRGEHRASQVIWVLLH